MENLMKNLTILAAAAALVASSISIAKADSPFEPRSVTVKFADLDTTNAEGAATLYRRLKSAAASVCRGLEPDKQLSRVWGYNECLHTAMSNAIVKINRPAVAEYAAAHGVPMSNPTVRIANNK
jgi:UrcA family protein